MITYFGGKDERELIRRYDLAWVTDPLHQISQREAARTPQFCYFAVSCAALNKVDLGEKKESDKREKKVDLSTGAPNARKDAPKDKEKCTASTSGGLLDGFEATL